MTKTPVQNRCDPLCQHVLFLSIISHTSAWMAAMMRTNHSVWQWILVLSATKIRAIFQLCCVLGCNIIACYCLCSSSKSGNNRWFTRSLSRTYHGWLEHYRIGLQMRCRPTPMWLRVNMFYLAPQQLKWKPENLPPPTVLPQAQKPSEIKRLRGQVLTLILLLNSVPTPLSAQHRENRQEPGWTSHLHTSRTLAKSVAQRPLCWENKSLNRRLWACLSQHFEALKSWSLMCQILPIGEIDGYASRPLSILKWLSITVAILWNERAKPQKMSFFRDNCTSSTKYHAKT